MVYSRLNLILKIVNDYVAPQKLYITNVIFIKLIIYDRKYGLLYFQNKLFKEPVDS